MIAIIIALVINTIIVFFASYIVPGVRLYSLWNAIVVAVLLGLLHSAIHNLAMFLTLPPNFFSYFLTTFVLASVILYLLSLSLPGFEVDGWKWIFIFSFIVAIFNGLIHHFFHA